MTEGPRAFVYTINGSSPATLNMGGGSFDLPQSTTVPVTLQAGFNTITFGNPGTYAPNLDRIVISGDGKEPAPDFTTYEAEAAQLSGAASVGGCSYCSGGAYVGNFGAGTQNAVTFNNVNVSQSGTYQMEVDYTENGPRSVYVYVNGGDPIELDVNGSSWDSPQFLIIPVQLNAGANTIVFTNPTSTATPQDSTASRSPRSLVTRILAARSPANRVRIFSVNGSSPYPTPATRQPTALRSTASPVAVTGNNSGCKAAAVFPAPLRLGAIPANGSRNVTIPVVFSPACSADSTFAAHAVFSADQGADVGTLVSTTETR